LEDFDLSKAFDPIHATVEWRPDLSSGELARRGIRSIQRRLANPEMQADCRTLALHELKRWRLLIMLARGGKL